MKEFIEKLIGRLEELITDTYYKSVEGSRSAGIENNAYHNVRKIVNQLAEEYKEQNNDQDLMIVESLPSLYPMMQPFEVEAIDRVVSSAKYSGGWIPCSERFPEEDEKVIVSTKTELVYVGVYTKRYGFNKRQGFVCEDGFMWINNAIAWQPLPEPFKGE